MEIAPKTPIPLAVLLVEDVESDAQMLLRLLRKAGYELAYEQVETEAQMRDALERRAWDLVVSDYSLPGFNGARALRILGETGLDIPFIVVSGTVGEQTAVAMMKAGAHDYLMKDNLTRLVPAVQRELEQAQSRRERRQAEKALAASEAKLRALVEQVPAIVYTESAGTRETTYISPQVEAVTGYTPAEWIQDHGLWHKVIHPDDRGAVIEADSRTTLTREPFNSEYRLVTRDGRELWIHDEAVLVQSPSGAPLFWQGMMYDITERKRVEEAMRESERFARATVDALSAHIAILDENGIIMAVNHAWRKFNAENGQSGSDLQAREGVNYLSVCELACESRTDEVTIILDGIRSVMSGERDEFMMDYPCHSPEEKRWFNIHVTRFPGDGPLRVVVAHENITKLKLAEYQTREQSKQLEILYEASQKLNRTLDLQEIYQAVYDFMSAVAPNDAMLISRFDPETRLITCLACASKYGWRDVSGFPPIPLGDEGKGTQSLVIQSGQPLLLNDYQKQMKTASSNYYVNDETNEVSEGLPPEGGEATRSALIVPLKNGERVSGVIQVMSYRPNAYTENQLKLLESLSLHIASAEQNALLYARAQKELGERRQAEESLRASEARYRGLFNSMIDGFALHEIICDKDGKPVDYRFLEVNPAFERLTGLRSIDLIGKNVSEVLPDTEAYWIEIYGNVALTGRPAFYENYSAAVGRHFEVSAYCPRPKQFAVILVDVTERRTAEEDVRRRVVELEMLYQSGLALSQLLNPAEIGHKILELLEEKLNWRHTRIRLYHPQDDLLELLDFNQPGLIGEEEHRKTVERFQSLITHAGEGMSGWVVQHGIPVRCGDVENDRRYVEAYPGIRSGLYVPMKLGERVVGVISIEDEKPNAFTEADERLIATLANQAASAFENARLFAEIRQRVVELETLNRVSLVLRSVSNREEMLAIILDEALFLMNTPHGSIELFNKSTESFDKVVTRGWTAEVRDPPQTIREGIIGRVFTSGEIYVAREFVSDPEARDEARVYLPSGWGGVCLPIRASQQALGVMLVSVPIGRELNKDEIRLLSIFSEMTGAALQRMQLHEQTARRLEQLNALRAVDQAISSSRDMQLTLNILLTHTISQLNLDAAEVLLHSAGSSKLEFAAGQGFRTLPPRVVGLNDRFAGRAVMQRRLVSMSDFDSPSQVPQPGKAWRDEGFLRGWCMPLIIKGEVKGVLEVYSRRAFIPDAEWIEFLETFAGQAAIAIDNTQLFENLQRANVDLSLAYEATIEGWSRALDMRDHETEGHALRVTELTLSLARTMGVGELQLADIRRGALLHDIGKMGVPDAILLKDGNLTEEEWSIMRRHPQLARDMLLPITYLKDAFDIPYCHHEKWDGTGYPQGLKGEQIPLAARIFAIVDVWDALTNDRTYRRRWEKQQALEYIREQSGFHFDPQVVEVFLRYIGRD